MAKHNSLKKVGFRVVFPNGATKKVNTRAEAKRIIAERGYAIEQCELRRIGRSHNGAKVYTPVAW